MHTRLRGTCGTSDHPLSNFSPPQCDPGFRNKCSPRYSPGLEDPKSKVPDMFPMPSFPHISLSLLLTDIPLGSVLSLEQSSRH